MQMLVNINKNMKKWGGGGNSRKIGNVLKNVFSNISVLLPLIRIVDVV